MELQGVLLTFSATRNPFTRFQYRTLRSSIQNLFVTHSSIKAIFGSTTNLFNIKRVQYGTFSNSVDVSEPYGALGIEMVFDEEPTTALYSLHMKSSALRGFKSSPCWFPLRLQVGKVSVRPECRRRFISDTEPFPLTVMLAAIGNMSVKYY